MKTKYFLITLLGYWSASLSAQAQLKTGNNSFYISPGTVVTVSALSLTPTEGTNLNNNEITHSSEPVVGKPTGSIYRVYKLANPFSFKGQVLINYLESELNGNSEDMLQIASAGVNEVYQIPTNKSSADPILDNVHETGEWTNVSFITATSSGSVLPVTLVDFVAAQREDDIVLTWSTSFEANSDFFEIQHSTDGKNWLALGTVKSNGDSKIERTYSYVHERPLASVHYYRLRMVDNDGSYAFSRIRDIRVENNLSIAFHPNPVADLLTIEMPNAQQLDHIKIINKSGKVVYEANKTQFQQLRDNAISLKQLTAGIYVIQVRDQDGTLHSSKLIKN
ncbi:T9SS type A sorting domain-containing protein [Dyadobacter sp. LJ53]|uniref:T9SS type A sorting domain-containing protein n=1 Tax=Dyadobacter chenwenxiniae TaxID=2906456 RepID=UPI001F3A907B|nr:T9SS type A sorting domain-containing protein [Dyadobacter chenwenxiniae]MCF0051744.1 T9SS type A sorting domain-containing protein [Dyadobacter chenwenxiniae]